MPYYLVQCPCGHSLEVDSALAGGSVTCPECQATVEVPSLRHLKELPRAESSVKTDLTPAGAQESNLVGNLGSILVILSVLALAALSYARYYSVTGITAEDAIQWGHHQIDSLSPTESWELWKEIQDGGMGAREETLTQIEERRVLVIYILMGVATAVAFVGIGMVVSSKR